MSARVEIYREELADWEGLKGKWRWRFIKNGRIMADSGQGYSRRIDALNGCATVLGGQVAATPGVDHIFRRGYDSGGWNMLPVVDLTREAS
jgi:uncharacterized protein YegP (UPF0339 family)